MVAVDIKSKLAYYGGEKSLTQELKYHWPIILENDVDYVAEVIRNGELSFNNQDKEIKKLESFFISLLNTKYAIALNSGTSALFLAFLILDLKKGDKIAVPTYTFPATLMPLMNLGVEIVFIDTEEDSTRMSVSDLRNKIDDSFKCIVVAHMDGISSNIEEIKKIAEESHCFLVEDCAQSLGSTVNGKYLGTFGDVGIFSLQQKKLIASGEGGVLVTSDKKLYEKAVLYSYLQKRSYDEITLSEYRKYVYTGLGYNFRIHPFSAALANCQLSRFNEILEMRTKSMLEIANGLKDVYGITVLRERDNETNSFYTLKILFNYTGDLPIHEFIELMKAEGVILEKSLTQPLNEDIESLVSEDSNEFFNSKVLKSKTENSKNVSNRLMRMLPFYNLSNDQIEQIVGAFKKVSNYMESLEVVK